MPQVIKAAQKTNGYKRIQFPKKALQVQTSNLKFDESHVLHWKGHDIATKTITISLKTIIHIYSIIFIYSMIHTSAVMMLNKTHRIFSNQTNSVIAVEN